jgi:hypothetical protein
MGAVPQFIVTFRGVEVGRYDTADRAMAAARSVIDTELGSRMGSGDREPGELPRIEWQPPPVPFPFDAFGYWRHRLQSQMRDAPPPRPAPAPAPRPTPPPTAQVSLEGLNIPGDGPMLPRRPEPQPAGPPPVAPVYGGPPAPESAERADRSAQTTVYSGPPPWAASPPQPPTRPAPPPSSEEPKAGRRRWFGKDRGQSE